jgi:hypothetical protein
MGKSSKRSCKILKAKENPNVEDTVHSPPYQKNKQNQQKSSKETTLHSVTGEGTLNLQILLTMNSFFFFFLTMNSTCEINRQKQSSFKNQSMANF